MAEHERDERVSAAYRGLGREEPPAGLDAAILAAARRPRRRWAVPVSIAAVVVLAVGVTLRVQLEQPEEAQPVAMAPRVLQAPATPPVALSEVKKERRAPAAAAPAPAAEEPALRMRQAPARDSVALGARGTDARAGAADETPRQEVQGTIAPAAPAVAGRLEYRPAPLGAQLAGKPETPEEWLERIARLRAEGKDREADESLAEFKRRFPDYEIPEKMRARLERR
jgi:hypothetical protein